MDGKGIQAEAPQRLVDVLVDACTPPAKQTVWEWANANIDYSRVLNYDSEWKEKFSIDYIPYMKEPMEVCADLYNGIKEVWIWACTRAGKTEDCLLTPMRFLLTNSPPYSMLYIGAQQEKVEDFLEKRVIRGMHLSVDTERILDNAEVNRHSIGFGLCDLIVSWANNKQVTKGDSYPVIFADEVSSWPAFKADTLRERQATFRHPKLIGVSSADAESKRTSEQDPIIIEWENTDRREYQMPDPKDKDNLFSFVMGGAETPYGVKWDHKAKRDDGTWDLDIVENTAYYVTPGGARLEEQDRMEFVSKGKWVPTAKCISWKRGYRLNRMITPFPTGNFGNMARAFLEAVHKQRLAGVDETGRPPLRVFMYERLSEKYYTEKRVPELNELDNRKADYKLVQRLTQQPLYKKMYERKRAGLILTVDIQKGCEWWVLREWTEGGDSALVDTGQSNGLVDLREIGIKHKPIAVLIDNSYAERADEIIEAASIGLLKGSIICYGRDNIKDKDGRPREYVVFIAKDPYEGTARQGMYKCNSVTFLPDKVKNVLCTLTNGNDWHKWRIPDNIPSWYYLHMTAEQSTDGRWTKIRRDNHIWDCEVLQVLGAKLYGFWRENQTIADMPNEPPKPEEAKPDAPIVLKQKPPLVDPNAPHCPAGHGPMRWDGKRYWTCDKCPAAKEGKAPDSFDHDEDED